MNDNIDLNTLLLDKFELVLSVISGEDRNIQTKLYMHYVVLKIKLFHRWGRREDLEETIAKGKYVVTETQEEHEDYAARLNNFGIMLKSQYERTRTMRNLEKIIRVTR